jgi:hypothetical protein
MEQQQHFHYQKTSGEDNESEYLFPKHQENDTGIFESIEANIYSLP